MECSGLDRLPTIFAHLRVPLWRNSFSCGADVSQPISPFLPSRESNPAHPIVLPDETRLAVVKNGITAHQWAGDGIRPEQAMDLTDAFDPNGIDFYRSIVSIRSASYIHRPSSLSVAASFFLHHRATKRTDSGQL